VQVDRTFERMNVCEEGNHRVYGEDLMYGMNVNESRKRGCNYNRICTF